MRNVWCLVWRHPWAVDTVGYGGTVRECRHGGDIKNEPSPTCGMDVTTPGVG